MFMKRPVDIRIKLLAGILLVGLLWIAGYMAWGLWQTNVRAQFGDPSSWPRYETEINNIAFRVPQEMDVVIPKNEIDNPVSVKGPGGTTEKMLIQVGTWRPEKELEGFEDTIERYEARFPTVRKTKERVSYMVDGREGLTFVQDEESGREIVIAFFWDHEEARELSLQLSAHATPAERTLFKRVFSEMIERLEFLKDPADSEGERPDDVPFVWRKTGSATGGFSFWHPPYWVAIEDIEETLMQFPFVMRPENAAPAAVQPRQEPEAALYLIQALSKDQPVTLEALEAQYAAPFRETALEGSVSAERVGLPGVGVANSLEGVIEITNEAGKEEQRLVYLTVIAGTDFELGQPIDSKAVIPARGYLMYAVFDPAVKQRQRYIEDVLDMTRSFRIDLIGS